MTKRDLSRRILLSLLAILTLCGCTTQLPLVSHAHVGHALTNWHDTPGQQGLMTVAAADLKVAERAASQACANPQPHAATPYVRDVINALVPEAQPEGPASGYGAVRALMATIEHLEYAATSDDASLNLVAAVARLSVHGESVHARLEVATDLAQNLLTASPTDWPGYCDQLVRELRVAIHGGVAGPGTGGFPSIGFDELHNGLIATLEREKDPVYTPVPRRYVLGLVRMPSGAWQYRLSRPDQESLAYYGNYGY